MLNRCSFEEVKKAICQVGKRKQLHSCYLKANLVAEVKKDVGWAKFGILAVLYFGWKGVTGLKVISTVMGHHGTGTHPCRVSVLCCIQVN